jgi:TPR repeat protein
LLAAKQSLRNAEYMVGLFYQKGMGVPSDAQQAAYWYLKASEHGMDNAQLLLGIMYAQGQGIPKDSKLAYTWLNLASTSNNTQVRDAAAKLRDDLAKSMTPTDIDAAKQLSKNYYSKYADL